MRPLPPLFCNVPRHQTAFRRLFGTDHLCRWHVFHTRFPNGLTCPSCRGTSFHLERHDAVCNDCEEEVSLIEGTIFARTRHDLLRWFHAAFYLITIPGLSAKRLARLIAVTYKTGWTWKQKILSVLERTSRFVTAPRPEWNGSRLQDADFADPELLRRRWNVFVEQRGCSRPPEPMLARRARVLLAEGSSSHLSDKHLARNLDHAIFQLTVPVLEGFLIVARLLPTRPPRSYREIVGARTIRPWLVFRSAD